MIVEIKQLYVYPVKDPGSYPIYAHEDAAFKLLNGCIGTNIIKGSELEGCLYNIFKDITRSSLRSVSGFTRMNYFEIARTCNYLV